MATRLGRCTNFGNCTLANAKKPIDPPPGQDFICPECGKTLILSEPRKSGTWIVLGALVLTIAIGTGWLLFATSKPPVLPAPTPEPSSPSSAQVTPAEIPPATEPPAPLPAPVPLSEPPSGTLTTPALAPDIGSKRLPPCGADDSERWRLKLCD